MTKFYIRKIGLLAVFLLVVTAVSAQLKVTGTVKGADDGQSLPGVSVKVKSAATTVSTDEKGRYTINVPNNATLIFSYVGYKLKEVPVGTKTEINVSLTPDQQSLTDVVVVGYQQVKRKNSTAALATVTSKDIENLPAASVDVLLQGKLPGVNVQNFTGQPGVSTSLMVRGNTRIMSAGEFDGDRAFSNPLYVIDGLPVAEDEVEAFTQTGTNFLTSLNPNDVESIDVLKDASAAAIYGSRGANGVILIKTKRGVAGVPKVSFNTYYGMVRQPKFLETVIGAEERRRKMDLIYNYANAAQLRDRVPIMLTDSLNPSFNNNNNWQDLFYQNGTVSNQDLAVSGGSERFNYRVGVGHYDEKGIIKATGYERYSINANLGANFSEKFQMQTSLRLSRGLRMVGRVRPEEQGYRNAFKISPVSMPSSLFYLSEQDRLDIEAPYESVRNSNADNNISAVTKLTYNIVKNLSINTEGAISYSSSKRDFFSPARSEYNGRAYAYSGFSEGLKYLITNTLVYSFNINDTHNLNFLAGQAFEKRDNQSLNVSGEGVPNDNIKVVSGVAQGDLFGSSDHSTYAKLSFFGSAHYDYEEKYLFDSYIRADASSRFGRDNRWAIFPSFSAAWIASEENFMKNVSWIDFAKLRFSWGLSGDEASIGDNDRYNSFALGNANYGGSSAGTYGGVPVIYPNFNRLTNNNLTWEQSDQTNIGVDLEFFKRRISFTADAYVRNTTGQMLKVLVPETSGYSTSLSNAAGVRNSGLEFQISGRVFKPESAFQWTPSINISFNSNMVTALPNGNRDLYSNGTIYVVGKPLNMYQMYITDGVINSISDLLVNPYTGQVGSTKWGTLILGMPKWRDITGDYKISDNNGENDITFYGDPNPKATGGINNSFRYKNFSLSVFTTFTLGRTIVNNTLAQRLSNGLFYGNPEDLARASIGDYEQYDYWRKAGDNATFPALNPFSGLYVFRSDQTFYVEPGWYFRIKNVNLGYDFTPQNYPWMRKVKLNRMKLYAMVDNLAMFQKFSGIDAEAVNAQGYDFGDGYPIPRKYTFGLQVEF